MITGFRPNLTIFDELGGKSDTVPILADLTFASAILGGIRYENIG